MRKWPTLTVAVAVLVVGAASGFLLTRGDETSTGTTTTTTTWFRADRLIGRFVITAIDTAGNSQQATFTCGGGNTVSGYLVERGTLDACRTAIGDANTRDYLETGKRPRANCGAIRRITHAGWRYVITGESANPLERRYMPVHQQLTVKTKCDEALWQQMKEMLPES